MNCKRCGNEIEKPHMRSRKLCKRCQKENQKLHVKLSRLRLVIKNKNKLIRALTLSRN